MQAPTVTDLLNHLAVQQMLEQAWTDSMPSDALKRHEEGGWIYFDTTTGAITHRRAPAGAESFLDLSNAPILPGSTVVATFHTHPNPRR